MLPPGRVRPVDGQMNSVIGAGTVLAQVVLRPLHEPVGVGIALALSVPDLRDLYWIPPVGKASCADDRILASGGGDGDGTVRLWNPITGQPIDQPIAGLVKGVSSVAGRMRLAPPSARSRGLIGVTLIASWLVLTTLLGAHPLWPFFGVAAVFGAIVVELGFRAGRSGLIRVTEPTSLLLAQRESPPRPAKA